MRVAFECLRGRFVRLGLDDGGQDDVVARVGDAGGGDALGFSGRLRAKNHRGAFLHPRVPFAFQLVFGGFLFRRVGLRDLLITNLE
jgi:hypothetical protein